MDTFVDKQAYVINVTLIITLSENGTAKFTWRS